MAGRTHHFLPLAVMAGALAVESPIAAQTSVPSVDQLVSVRRVGSPALSADGRRVAFTIRDTNWEADAFETEIWIRDLPAGELRQLTDAKGSSSAPAWSPRSSQLAFLSDRSGKQQLYLIDVAGGEARALTSGDEAVSALSWSPDGAQIAFTRLDPVADSRESRDKQYGELDLIDEDYRYTHLFVIDLATRQERRLTEGTFTVGSFAWSPDGRTIAFDHRINADPANNGSADISLVTVATGQRKALVTLEGPDSHPVWSPDGASIAFESAMANPQFYYRNGRIATVPFGGGTPVSLTDAFDEDPSLVAWRPAGIFFEALQRTDASLYRLDPQTKITTRVGPGAGVAAQNLSMTADGAKAAYIASSATAFPDVFVMALDGASQPVRVSDLGSQLAQWTIGSREIVRWKSTDGAEIEGVLHKPADFRAGRRYPLLVVIHGGPTGISRPTPLSGGFAYPIEIWLSKGALVLQPNYRGSAGYGEAFRSLNVRNLGVGDAWDVVSGVDHLVGEGLVDETRVGTMGWSQGGYISAFLTTHDSARFKAASVGAGISDWMTYYVNTDIHPFTRQYLQATPWDDPEIYATTSPMTYIKNARTPTLIQHGEKDQRVPPPNAFELYQGLRDGNVPTRLVIYKGFGHALTKPKAQRAAMEHNLDWFDRYLFASTPTSSGIER